jgi:TonB family protein
MRIALRHPLTNAIILSIFFHGLVLGVLLLIPADMLQRRSKSVQISIDLVQELIQEKKRTTPVPLRPLQPQKNLIKKKTSSKVVEPKQQPQAKPELVPVQQDPPKLVEKETRPDSDTAEAYFSSDPDSRALAERKRAIDDFLAQILYCIEQAKHYPLLARRLGKTGTVKCRFIITRDGMVQEATVIKPAKFSVLNKAAIDAIKKGKPYPQFPPFLTGDTFASKVDITFQLD